MAKISAIIFDLDDLIVDSSGLHFRAYEYALKKFGVSEVLIPDDLCRRIYGMRIREIMELMAAHFKLDVDVAQLTKIRDEHFLELVKKGVRPMPGLKVLVRRVEEWGLRRAVASSGIRDYVDEALRQLGLGTFFEAVITGEDVVNPKPAPDTFLLAAKSIGVPPDECAVLEDSTKGLVAAKRAGMLAIGVRNSITDSGQDMSAADVVVDRLDEITLELLS